MGHSFSTLFIVVALGLVVAIMGAGSVFLGASLVYAAVSVAEDDVEWAAANGDDISLIGLDVTSHIYVRDAGLETTVSGTAVFSGIPANSKFFNIATGAAGASSPGTTTGVTRVLTAPG